MSTPLEPELLLPISKISGSYSVIKRGEIYLLTATWIENGMLERSGHVIEKNSPQS